MPCEVSGYIGVGSTFYSDGGNIKVLSVHVPDPFNVFSVSYDLRFTAPNGETTDVPGAGIGFEADFNDINTTIRVWDLSFDLVYLEICYPEPDEPEPEPEPEPDPICPIPSITGITIN